MAIYHFSTKIIKRSAGRSATAAAAYRSGAKIVDERTGLAHDYSRKSDVYLTSILAPENAPTMTRSELWNLVETSEKRKDSQVAREIEVALPRELTATQMNVLINEYAHSQFVSRGMIADVAIHNATGDTPHAHILLTTREITADGFGQKNRDWNQKDLVKTWREEWEKHANQALEKAGHKARIDHRTLEAQGIERIPQIKLGPNVIEMERRGIKTDRGEKARQIKQKNAKIIDLAARRAELEGVIEKERPREKDIYAIDMTSTKHSGLGALGWELGSDEQQAAVLKKYRPEQIETENKIKDIDAKRREIDVSRPKKPILAWRKKRYMGELKNFRSDTAALSAQKRELEREWGNRDEKMRQEWRDWRDKQERQPHLYHGFEWKRHHELVRKLLQEPEPLPEQEREERQAEKERLERERLEHAREQAEKAEQERQAKLAAEKAEQRKPEPESVRKLEPTRQKLVWRERARQAEKERLEHHAELARQAEQVREKAAQERERQEKERQAERAHAMKLWEARQDQRERERKQQERAEREAEEERLMKIEEEWPEQWKADWAKRRAKGDPERWKEDWAQKRAKREQAEKERQAELARQAEKERLYRQERERQEKERQAERAHAMKLWEAEMSERAGQERAPWESEGYTVKAKRDFEEWSKQREQEKGEFEAWKKTQPERDLPTYEFPEYKVAREMRERAKFRGFQAEQKKLEKERLERERQKQEREEREAEEERRERERDGGRSIADDLYDDFGR